MRLPAAGPWTFTYDGFEPAQEGLREALCTLGNGYLATRGAFPGSVAGDVHYPGTYVGGCYNRLTSEVAGRTVENESIVNLPDWTAVQIAIEDGDWLEPATVELLAYQQQLDLRRAILRRMLRWRDAQGRTTRLVERRLVHMRCPHLAAVELTLVAEDWSGRVRVRSGIDGRVRNEGVARYRQLAARHLSTVDTQAPCEDAVLLRTETNGSRIRVAEAARTRLQRGHEPATDVHRRVVADDDWIGHDLDVAVEAGVALTIDKVASIHTNRDPAAYEPGYDALAELATAGRFTRLLDSHVLMWRGLWNRFRVELHLDDETTRIARLHLFHVLQTVSPNTRAHDVGVPPRGLHGEAYRGLIMWDELFVLPQLNLRLPSLTRWVLAYRYHRLPAARRAARAAGYEGAMFPWQSAVNGEEFAQSLHLNPESGRWVPDPTHLQRHIGLAVAYNVWQYYETTGDDGFLAEQGGEMLLDIARFFASRAGYDFGRGRYVIRGVVGPDEFHTRYPGAAEPGIDNNAYTNVMAAWLFRRVVELPELLSDRRWDELADGMGVHGAELARWEEMSRLLEVPFHDGVISQYEGYERLAELDWDALRRKHGDIHRLDRILEAHGDTPDRYKASKQADVLMLFYLLSADELRDLFSHLGYALDADTITRTIDYYLERTTHGSTLSAVVHGWVLARSRRHRALEFFRQALASDVHDVQGGTTQEGVHLGAMAGSVDLLLRCFTGVEPRAGVLRVNPLWPEDLGPLEFDIVYRGSPLTLRVTGDTVRVTHAPDGGAPVTVSSPATTAELEPGESVELTTRG